MECLTASIAAAATQHKDKELAREFAAIASALVSVA